MRKFTQGVDLIHKLRKLRSTEELANNRLHRLCIDKSTRGGGGQFAVHAVAGGFSHLVQPNANLVFQEFADTAYAAVTQVVNIVHFERKIIPIHLLRIFPGVEGQEVFNRDHNVFGG